MSGERSSILIVDDDPDEAELARLAFAGRPFDVRIAGGGAQAIALLESQPAPDLVLLDLKMPGVGGLEVLRWVRASAALRDLPVVMFTSSDLPAEIAAAEAAGADAYLCKSPDIASFDEVARRLSEILAARGDRKRGSRGPFERPRPPARRDLG